jgi:hypothetical protein
MVINSGAAPSPTMPNDCESPIGVRGIIGNQAASRHPTPPTPYSSPTTMAKLEGRVGTQYRGARMADRATTS